MARQGWGVSIATAIGVAAGAGAAQLGFGYGLGVITWTPTDAGATDTAWADGLAWATWLAASSTVLGAVCAQRLHQRSAPAPAEPQAAEVPDSATSPEQPTQGGHANATATATEATVRRSAPEAEAATHDRGGLLRRVALALSAGIGGLVTVLLIAVPARVATGADTGAPQRTAAVQATLGILIGVLVAIWALRSRVAAINVTATAAWLWLLAVVSVIDGVRVGRGLTGAQLGTWQLDPDHPRYWISDQLYWPGALLALVPALLIGVLAARRAARSAGHRVGAAASGAAGPVLVALAYLTTLPHWSTLGPAQLSTQLIAPYAVIAGIGGSVLAAVLAERADRSAAASATKTDPAPADRADPAPATGGGSTSTGRATPAPITEADSGLSASGSPLGTAARRGRADATPRTTRAGSLPGEATAAPRVPAPRTEPNLSGPAHPAESGAAEDPTASGRRTRATRRSTRPTTD
ncbi:hypothetical protein [Micromonospora parathelypteridis]|uniref:Uncharacterized protein n=1 Tax=Micromonospora parathelypteridis TaxID=1839617 RepID=A0A840W5F4_9ACTN|nr:hypothetical protein [Micromonospora parathelypteridis]MBB5478351.1 hypothetical protein [Micromonospora parathelypteridis]GGO06651.1 hypothetical protein GCM10011576_10600 [Micromonospora parathelypteridis]